MRQSTFAVALLSAFSLPASAQIITLPVLTPGGPLATLTTSVFSALPAPLTTSAPLPVDATVLENGHNGSGFNQVLGLGSNNATATVIGNQLNNTVGTPLLGLPVGTAQPIDIAVLGGDDVGNSNLGGVAGIAVLSGNRVANGGLIGAGLLNGDNSGNGQLLGVAALSGHSSGNASQGLGVGLLNPGETLGVSAGGTRVLTLGAVSSQLQGALPGLDQSGLAIGGGLPVSSSNPLLNAGVLAGNNAGSGGLVGVAALSGSNTANAQMVGVGVLNQGSSGKGLLGVDVLSGSGSGVSSNGIGAGVLSGDNSGTGSAVGAGILTGSNSGSGGMLGAGVLSGNNSGKAASGAGVAALSGGNSGTGGALGSNVAGANNGAANGGGGGAGTGGNGGNGGTGGAGGGNGANPNGSSSGSGSSSAGSAYAYAGSAEASRTSVNAADACKLGYKNASGKMVRPDQCQAKPAVSKS